MTTRTVRIVSLSLICAGISFAQTGLISTYAGTGTCSYTGDRGPALQATMCNPSGAIVDSSGNIYFFDNAGATIRQITPAGIINTIAGNGVRGTTGNGGPALNAELGFVAQLAYDGVDNICFGDTLAYQIRCVSLSTGMIQGYGTGTPMSAGDGGPVANASFYDLNGIAFVTRYQAPNVYSDIYVSEMSTDRIRKVDGATGIVTTVAGTGQPGFSGDGGPATSAQLYYPYGLAYYNGSLYVADSANYRVRQLNLSTGIITTVAGDGVPYYAGDGGPATAAQFSAREIAFDAIGDMYIADSGRIREVNTSGIINTYAGNGDSGIGPDGVPPSQTWFSGVNGILWNPVASQLLISDGANKLRQVLYQATTISVTAAPNPVAPGGQVALTASVAPGGTGTVNFYQGSTLLGSATLSAGQAIFNWTVPPAGGTVMAVYLGDSNNAPSTSSTIGVTVQKTATSTVVTGTTNPSTTNQNVTLIATISPSAATGSVQFLDGSSVLGTATVASGTATFGVSTLSAGLHTITAAYSGDANFAASTSPAISQTVLTASSATVNSSPNPSFVGAAVTLVATVVPPTATGTVQFLDAGTVLGSATLAGGAASFSTSTLAQGANSITVVYSGDANDAGSTSAVLTQTVNAKAVTTTVVTATPNPSIVGGTVTLAATVSPATATGTVQFLDGSSVLSTGTLAGGTASFSTSTFAQGTHSITAVYSGDAGDVGSTSSAVQQTVKASTTTSLTSSANPITLGGSVTFTAAVVPAAATGTVQFTVYNSGNQMSNVSVTVTGGMATWTTPNLSSGSNTVTAVYSGDANYGGSTSAAVNEAVRFTSYTVLSSSPNPSVIGSAVALTATLYPANNGQTGSVQFFNGATLLGTGTVGASGVAQLTTTTLPAGTDSLTASYSGDTNWAPSASSAIQQTVNKASTTTSLSSSSNPSTVGGAVTLVATVSSSTATGTLQFLDGATVLSTGTLAGGSASLTTSTLTPGTHSITAVYSGDTNNAGSTSSVVSQIVNKLSTSVGITTNPAFPTVGQTVSIVAAVTPAAATGAVNFYTGSTLLGTSNLTSGQATFPITATSAGLTLVNLMAVYQGDSNDSGSSSPSISVTVAKASTTTGIASSVNPSVQGQAVTFTATVTPSAATGTVTFSGLGTATVANGVASITTTTLSVGTTTVTAQYSGDSNYNSSTSTGLAQSVKSASTTSLTSSVNPSTVAQSITFTATVTPSTAAGSIQFLDGATVIGTASVSSGKAVFSTSALAQGTHSIAASYSGDASDTASTSSALTQTVNLGPPSAPSNLTATTEGSSQINLAWTASATSGVTYNIYASTSAGFTPSAANRIATAVATTSYSSTGLSASTTYYFRVTAVNAGGESAATNQASAETSGVTSCHVVYSVSDQWNNGFTDGITIQNTGTTKMNSWTLTWTWPGNQEVTQSWNANYAQSGANVTLTNMSYNSSIAPGKTITGVGFNGRYSGSNPAPTAFYVNGTLCH